MPYRIEVLPAAARDSRKLPKAALRAVDRAFGLLAEDPRPPAAKALKGFRGCYRVRLGTYRLVYRIRDELLVVLVLAVAHRREVYEVLRRREGG